LATIKDASVAGRLFWRLAQTLFRFHQRQSTERFQRWR